MGADYLRTMSAGGFTSHADWNVASVVRTYWKPTELKATFRSLKGEIGLRPTYTVRPAVSGYVCS